MRGKDFHNFLVDKAKMTFLSYNWQVHAEYRYQKNGITTYFDLYATKDDNFIACEIETTPRHVIDNITKALTAGVDIWVIVPTRVLLNLARQKNNNAKLNTNKNQVKVLLLGQLQKEIKKFKKNSDRYPC